MPLLRDPLRLMVRPEEPSRGANLRGCGHSLAWISDTWARQAAGRLVRV